MRRLPPVACCHTAIEGASQRLEWDEVLELVLEVHEIANGVVLDLPANKYELVIDLVDHELGCCESAFDLSVGRKEGIILLTATSNTVQGLSEIRSILDSVS